MKSQLLVILTLQVLLIEGSQKKGAAAQEKEGFVIVQEVPNIPSLNSVAQNATSKQIEQLSKEKSGESVRTDQHPLSSEPSAKVVRHLGPKVLRGEGVILTQLKRPWFSSKTTDKHIKIFKKMRGKPGEPEIMRYAPRSLDMGLGPLINYNNLESLYGNQALMPTSGTPNSLDHLYLPEFAGKDYVNPVDFNGKGQLIRLEVPHQAPYADSFGYQNKLTNFRGHPIDINYHTDVGSGGMNAMGPVGPRPAQQPYTNPSAALPARGGYPHHPSNLAHMDNPSLHRQNQDQGEHPPPPASRDPPNKIPEKGPNYDKPSDHNPEDRLQDGPSPTGSDEVQGDAGLWGILDLAHLLQGSGGLPEQLLNAGNAFTSQPQGGNHHPDSNQDRKPYPNDWDERNEHFDDDRGGNDNYNNFDSDGNNGGNRQYDSQRNEGYNNFDFGPGGDKLGDGGPRPYGFQNFEDRNYGRGRPKPYNTPSRNSGGRNGMKVKYSNFRNGHHNHPDKPRAHGPNPGYDGDNPYEHGQGQHDFQGPNAENNGQDTRNYNDPGYDDRDGERHRGYPYRENEGLNSPKNHRHQFTSQRGPTNYDNSGGFDDEGSYYNSQEQFDPSRRRFNSKDEEHTPNGFGGESFDT